MIGIIGMGRMGTALAYILSKTNPNHNIYMWGRRLELVKIIKKYKRNLEYFPNIGLPDNIIPTANLYDLRQCDIFFIAIPSYAVREIVRRIGNMSNSLDGIIIVNTAKGVEFPPFKRLSQVIQEEVKNSTVAILYGPTFADELIKGVPSGFTLSSNDKNAIRVVKKILNDDRIVVDTTTDVIGVEMCGILKNIYAIALGICDSIGVETNTYYLVLTQAFKEMKIIVTELGGKVETLFSYCGIGDLCLTSSSDKSRNRTLGLLYGKQLITEINKYEASVISEGRRSIVAIKDLCRQLNIVCPLLDYVYSIVVNKKNPQEEFYNLWKQLKEYDRRNNTFSRNW